MSGLKQVLILAGMFGLIGLLLWPQRDLAPSVQYALLDGEILDSNSLQGLPVLVTFWRSDCEACVAEITLLKALKEATEERNMRIIAVSMAGDRPEGIRDVIARYDPNYQVALDRSGEIAQAYGNVTALPSYVLINPQGEVVYTSEGPLDQLRLLANLSTFTRGG